MAGLGRASPGFAGFDPFRNLIIPADLSFQPGGGNDLWEIGADNFQRVGTRLTFVAVSASPGGRNEGKETLTYKVEHKKVFLALISRGDPGTGLWMRQRLYFSPPTLKGFFHQRPHKSRGLEILS